jgi:hypothetical protein
MVVAIHANEGDWGGAHLSDIEAVARSVADSFAAFDDDDAIAITLEPTPARTIHRERCRAQARADP